MRIVFCPTRNSPARIGRVTRRTSWEDAMGTSITLSPLIAIRRRDTSGMTTMAFW